MTAIHADVSTTRSLSTVMSTCRHCWEPIIAAGVTGVPAWVHTGSRRAGHPDSPLLLADPVAPTEPAVQAALFDVPPARRRIGGAAW